MSARAAKQPAANPPTWACQSTFGNKNPSTKFTPITEYMLEVLPPNFLVTINVAPKSPKIAPDAPTATCEGEPSSSDVSSKERKGYDST